MTFAFSLVKLIFGCSPNTTCHVISLMSTDEFPGGWKYTGHLGLMANTWVHA